MPIYAYKCSACGHQQDVLQKLSDPLLTVCPACGQSTYSKQVTAAGFQLKGSGWYVTDFRNNGSKPGSDSGGKSHSGHASGTDGAAAAADKPASPDTAASANKPASADKSAAPAAAPAAPAAPTSSST
ncbi:zinc ribbon domain-containing protein [Candidimonas humi]|uniref:FmdB family zinc ribbon protein n=1 Tax=Candidimonas humi TaxID=683355 RepID=A0ABV8NXN1_9BURK|nr:zinc ribbon domain-containing protein [Candidimonas humi]